MAHQALYCQVLLRFERRSCNAMVLVLKLDRLLAHTGPQQLMLMERTTWVRRKDVVKGYVSSTVTMVTRLVE